jgi:ribosomal protein L11 methyltransferase
VFEEQVLSMSIFETVEDSDEWKVELLLDEIEEEAITERIHIYFTRQEEEMPLVHVTQVEHKDWLAEVARQFPPFSVGPFYLYGSHVKESIPDGQIGLQIDAGSAFGSGEHGTTSGCLQALAKLHETKHVDVMLDMGCGSGILAIAMAKLWHKPVIATDMDAVSVRVTAENAIINNIAEHVIAIESEGYASPQIKEHGPYDIVAANILANPLTAMAADAREHIKTDGHLILSGILENQAAQVITAYEKVGFALQEQMLIGQWSTLIFTCE